MLPAGLHGLQRNVQEIKKELETRDGAGGKAAREIRLRNPSTGLAARKWTGALWIALTPLLGKVAE